MMHLGAQCIVQYNCIRLWPGCSELCDMKKCFSVWNTLEGNKSQRCNTAGIKRQTSGVIGKEWPSRHTSHSNFLECVFYWAAAVYLSPICQERAAACWLCSRPPLSCKFHFWHPPDCGGLSLDRNRLPVCLVFHFFCITHPSSPSSPTHFQTTKHICIKRKKKSCKGSTLMSEPYIDILPIRN